MGTGVMLQQMGDNFASIKAYTDALNKTISTIIFENEESTLRIVFTDSTGIDFNDAGQSCCESRYMTTDDKFEEYIGAVFLCAKIKKAPSLEDAEYGDHDCEFLEIQTNKGCFTIVNHNEHNGYYGGFWIRVSDVRI